jgi:trk system potassium uptake protein TrkH
VTAPVDPVEGADPHELPSLADHARPRRRLLRHPGQVVVLAFAGAIGIGTALLWLPIASRPEGSAPFMDALFTSTSAVCVTGLVTVDTGSYWTPFGQVVILGLFQVGGFGIMTLATLIGLLLARRLGLAQRLNAAAETKTLGLGDVRRVLTGVATVTVIVEALTWLALTFRFALGYDEPLGRAAWDGLFHAVSAFNNAGFSLNEESLMGYVTDPWVNLPIAIAVILGGLGFPVILELRRHVAPRGWTLHTKLTLSMTGVLLLGGALFTAASEWNNADTIGGLNTPSKALAAFFHSTMSRTAGFNSVDIGAMSEGTWVGTIVLMFIGGGSAGTAGGIKVTTFLILFLVIWAEVRGERHVNAFHWRIDPRVQRQALSIALLGVAAVMAGTLLVVELSHLPLGPVWFEVTSAFGTVGLSTGITADLPRTCQGILVVLMFLGRLGPVTLASALALRERQTRFTYPEGRPIIG